MSKALLPEIKILQRQNRAKLEFERLVIKANLMFNNKFDYSKFEYKTCKDKSIIICPEHGEFLQNMKHHTGSNSHGCKQCWFSSEKTYKTRIIEKRLTFQDFYKRAFEKFGDKYIFIEDTFTDISQNITAICPIHGKIIKKCYNFLNSDGCVKCSDNKRILSKTQTYDKVIEKFNNFHNNKFSYPESNRVIYENLSSIIDVECPIHGLFKKRAIKHYHQGCFKCSIDNLIKTNVLVGGYCEELFLKDKELANKPAFCYLLKINDKYFKIGITVNPIKTRIRDLKAKARSVNQPIKVEILKIKENTLHNCFKLEQQILIENSEYRIARKWSTELLTNLNIQNYF